MANIRSNFCVTSAFFLNDWERINITILYTLASTVTAVGVGRRLGQYAQRRYAGYAIFG